MADDPVRVWVRTLGNGCRLSVDNLSGISFVLDRLSKTEALEGLDSIDMTVELKKDLPSASRCTFLIPGSPERTLASLEIALSEASGVELMMEPGRR
jgi:hypothetical protein